MNDGVLDPEGPPLPTAQVMGQWWCDISFLHWRVAPEVVAPLLPRGVRPDLHDGSAWVGLIPFRMVDAGLGRGRPVPWLGTFLETNVRLYSVDEEGRHGVVFRSLDADRLPVVVGANVVFGVPYRWAAMGVSPRTAGPDPRGSRLSYRSRRRGSGAGGRIDVEVGEPIGDPSPLEVFLTARFGLHTSLFGRTLWVPNTHRAWPLHRARLTHLEDTLVAAAGLPGSLVSSRPESVLFSPGVRTVFGLPQLVGHGRR
ncbi:YqjF family protein [Nocardioides sp. MAHUQ-72]|uniref:YqjF family protein n=1 Tax=unclassified Nocardioides TaxID=2615069 RepID=UPI00360B6F49